MNVVYENEVTDIGSLVGEFGGDMIITFGDNAPDTLKDYCYLINVKNTNKEISKNQYLVINEEKYKILLVGDIAEKNLVNLGHLTISFTGESEALPGTIVVEKKPCPLINIGTKIKIIE